ncbi:MAG: dihydrodipicolinate synthase family protein [Spirochaetes bacterium]|nr:dihydrodipicolinate synthase family protein [Spirochaetota bacterium]
MARKKSSKHAFSGVFPVVPTPLLEDQSVDFRGLERLVRFYIAEGCHGLLVLGSYGELPYFTFDERLEIIRRAARAAGGKIPVIACLGYSGLREAALFLEKSKKISVDGYLAVLPTYFSIRHEDCVQYYNELGDHTDRPVLYYHIPQITRISPSHAELAELLHLGHVVGIKDSSMNLPTLKRTTSLRDVAGIAYFAGSGLLLLETLRHGGAGVMCPIASISPRTVVGCHNAYRSGDYRTARRLQNEIFSFLPVLNSFSLPAGVQKYGFKVLTRVTMSSITPRQAVIKEYLRQAGFPITSLVRSPLPQISEADKAAVTLFLNKK